CSFAGSPAPILGCPGRDEGRCRWRQDGSLTPALPFGSAWAARHAAAVPLTGFVSRATHGHRFLSTQSCLGRINALRNGREASVGGTIRALERVPSTFLEPRARPRIQRGKLR